MTDAEAGATLSPPSRGAPSDASTSPAQPRAATARTLSRLHDGAPALERENVSMETGVLCDEVAIENGRAVGVRYTDSATGEVREVRATKEVILSAGSINTPQLLMLSGVGPAETLRRPSAPRERLSSPRRDDERLPLPRRDLLHAQHGRERGKRGQGGQHVRGGRLRRGRRGPPGPCVG